MTETPRELNGEEALAAAVSHIWDHKLPAEARKKIYKSIPLDQLDDVRKAIRAGRKLRKEGGAKQ